MPCEGSNQRSAQHWPGKQRRLLAELRSLSAGGRRMGANRSEKHEGCMTKARPAAPIFVLLLDIIVANRHSRIYTAFASLQPSFASGSTNTVHTGALQRASTAAPCRLC
eukprot:262267-Pelagomonas_calceolata.AAC.2